MLVPPLALIVVEGLLVQLIVLAVFGSIVAAIAHSRGRSPIGWFFIGAIAPCIGLILVLVLPDLNVEEDRRSRLRRDNQRLREQIRKERQVADQRHADTIGRLGAHDAALGLDTSTSSTERPPELPQSRSHAPTIDPNSRWHYAATEDAGTEGPVPFREIVALWNAGTLDGASLLWTKGMDDWLPIESLPDVEDELRRG